MLKHQYQGAPKGIKSNMVLVLEVLRLGPGKKKNPYWDAKKRSKKITEQQALINSFLEN